MNPPRQPPQRPVAGPVGALGVVGTYLGGVVLSWVVAWLVPPLRPPAPLSYLVSPLTLVAACLVAIRRSKAPPGVAWPGIVWTLVSLAAGTVLKFGADALVVLERPLFGPLRGNNPLIVHPQSFGDPWSVAALALAVVVLVPVAEELFFRGFLYGWLRSRLGPVGATPIAAVLFAAAHGSLGLMLPLTLVGAGLCVLYERRRSLWAPAIAHAMVNALALAFALAG